MAHKRSVSTSHTKVKIAGMKGGNNWLSGSKRVQGTLREVNQTTGVYEAMAKQKRTTHGLRDILFDELEELRSGDGDPTKATAVANLARQIIGVANLEMRFHEMRIKAAESALPVNMGSMELGTPVVSADAKSTGH